MPWCDPEDHSMPVISPPEQIRSKYPNMRIPVLPARAVVFCMGRGLTVLKELYSCEQIMEKLPGFITHSEVLGVKDVSGVCFLHGGYGAPQVACTIETLHVLGVKEVILAGLCGGFDEELSVGDILLPGKILSEEGTSLHYRETPGFAEVSPSIAFGRMEPFLRDKGYRVWHKDTVTTDAVYRQTFRKEKAWRDMGCAAVDMEASALVNICNLRDDETVVGTVTISGNGINRLFVLPQHQHRGYGRALLDFAEQKILSQDNTVRIDASFPAKQIYLKRGYRETEYHVVRTENGDYLCYDVMVLSKGGK